jgi:hypothetical protein
MLGSIGIAAVHAEEAKSPQANWENLKQLAPGQQIRVVLNDAKTYTGQLHSVSDESSVIRMGGGEKNWLLMKSILYSEVLACATLFASY